MEKKEIENENEELSKAELKTINNRIKNTAKRLLSDTGKVSDLNKEFLIKEVANGKTKQIIYGMDKFYLTLFDFSEEYIHTDIGFYTFQDKVYKLISYICENLLKDIPLSYREIKEYSKNIDSDNIEEY